MRHGYLVSDSFAHKEARTHPILSHIRLPDKLTLQAGIDSGLRPGEKLYEELLIGDDVIATEHPMIMRANEDHLSWDDFKAVLRELVSGGEVGFLQAFAVVGE